MSKANDNGDVAISVGFRGDLLEVTIRTPTDDPKWLGQFALGLLQGGLASEQCRHTQFVLRPVPKAE